MAKQLTMFPMSFKEAGRKGYLVTTGRMGISEFHSAGGQATAKLDGWTCACHGVGIFAYASHFPLKGKKHRY